MAPSLASLLVLMIKNSVNHSLTHSCELLYMKCDKGQKVSVNGCKVECCQKRKLSIVPAIHSHSEWTSFVFTQIFYICTKAQNLHMPLALTCTINQNISDGTSWDYWLKCPQTHNWGKFAFKLFFKLWAAAETRLHHSTQGDPRQRLYQKGFWLLIHRVYS